MAMTKRIDLISCHQNKVPKGTKISKQMNNNSASLSRLSPVSGKDASSPSVSPTTSPNRKTPTELINISPRASPGLVAGYYAGCKFTDPPSASTLPLPPQHWMITEEENHQTSMMMFPFKISSTSSSNDFTQQLKLLLKVQG